MPYTTDAIDEKILAFLKKRKGMVTARHFAGLGSNDAIRQALSRLVKQGKIQRVRRGLYQLPQSHRLLGSLPPDPLVIAKSVMEGQNARWQVSGAYAANLLGLSEQVPAKVVVLTDGIAKRMVFDRQEIVFRRAAPRNLLGAGTQAGLVFQALRYFGSDGVKPPHIGYLKNSLNGETKRDLGDLSLKMPRWMHPVIKQILKD